jgi:hypothetical protein
MDRSTRVQIIDPFILLARYRFYRRARRLAFGVRGELRCAAATSVGCFCVPWVIETVV